MKEWQNMQKGNSPPGVVRRKRERSCRLELWRTVVLAGVPLALFAVSTTSGCRRPESEPSPAAAAPRPSSPT
ncbi:MAG: hypothetical protein ACUVQK_15880, partial [Thermogutta sp.]